MTATHPAVVWAVWGFIAFTAGLGVGHVVGLLVERIRHRRLLDGWAHLDRSHARRPR